MLGQSSLLCGKESEAEAVEFALRLDRTLWRRRRRRRVRGQAKHQYARHRDLVPKAFQGPAAISTSSSWLAEALREEQAARRQAARRHLASAPSPRRTLAANNTAVTPMHSSSSPARQHRRVVNRRQQRQKQHPSLPPRGRRSASPTPSSRTRTRAEQLAPPRTASALLVHGDEPRSLPLAVGVWNDSVSESSDSEPDPDPELEREAARGFQLSALMERTARQRALAAQLTALAKRVKTPVRRRRH